MWLCARTQKSEKLAQMRSKAKHLLLVQSVARERFFIFGKGVLGRKYKVSFCPQIA